MTKSNPLCQAQECDTNFGCAHRGPHGQLCYFETEKRLCEFLGRTWTQHVTIEELLQEIEHRLVGLPPAGIAERFQARPTPSLNELMAIPPENSHAEGSS